MNDNELISSIKESLNKIAVPVTDVRGDSALLTGFCRIQGETSPLNYVMRVKDGYATIYMIAPYGEEALKKDDCYKTLASVNVVLAKGHFNADADHNQLLYKWVLPAVSFENDCDRMVKEFVVLPASMIIKYRDRFVGK